MKRRIKILRIIARLNIGGPAIHVALLTRGLDTERFESMLVAGRVSPREGDMGYLMDGIDDRLIMIDELQRELSLAGDLKTFVRILRILWRERPDIVHTHTAKGGAIGRAAAIVYNAVQGLRFRVQGSGFKVQGFARGICALRGYPSPLAPRPSPIKIVHTFHGHVFRGYFGRLKTRAFLWVERMLARRTDVIIAVSERLKAELSDTYRIARPEKIRVIRLGFDLAPFVDGRGARDEGQEARGEGQEWRIGIVGRLVPIKNHEMFLKAARIFVDQNPDISVKFLVVGDGELRNRLEAFCREQGLSDHVEFCGWKRDLAAVYAGLDILCLTSINEGTPVSIIEAMASSAPVVSTDMGGVRDLIADGGLRIADLRRGGFRVCERGVLVGPGDPEGLANALTHLIENEDVRARISNAGRTFAARTYSKERLLGDMEALYLELMGKVEEVRSKKSREEGVSTTESI